MSEREKLRDAVVEAARAYCRNGDMITDDGVRMRDAVRALDAAERPRFEARSTQVLEIYNPNSGPRSELRLFASGRVSAALVARLLNEHFEKDGR